MPHFLFLKPFPSTQEGTLFTRRRTHTHTQFISIKFENAQKSNFTNLQWERFAFTGHMTYRKSYLPSNTYGWKRRLRYYKGLSKKSLIYHIQYSREMELYIKTCRPPAAILYSKYWKTLRQRYRMQKRHLGKSGDSSQMCSCCSGNKPAKV